MTKKAFHKVYGILLSVALVVAGICLMVACVDIYSSGSRPFSREAVAAAFSGICVPVYICLALTAGGFLLDGFWAADKKKTVPEKQYDVILGKLCAKADVENMPEIQKERKARKTHKCITLALLAVGSIIFLSYGADPANFPGMEFNSSMVKAMYWLLPCMVVPFGYGIFTAYYCRKSIRREIDLVKGAIAAGAPAPAPAQQSQKRCYLGYVRWALLVFSIACLIGGFVYGGTKDVLTKAVNICTECVGLG